MGCSQNKERTHSAPKKPHLSKGRKSFQKKAFLGGSVEFKEKEKVKLKTAPGIGKTKEKVREERERPKDATSPRTPPHVEGREELPLRKSKKREASRRPGRPPSLQKPSTGNCEKREKKKSRQLEKSGVAGQGASEKVRKN